jgi:rhodanese-related sulfurtransferase
MNSRTFQRLGLCMLFAALGPLAAGCNSGSGDSAEQQSGGVATTIEREPAPATEAFARLDPSAFADRMNDKDAAVINVHIPYEGELADTDAFLPYHNILGVDRLPKDKDREILLYCRSGNMSEEAGAALHEQGYTKVAHLEGGMNAWEAAGRQLIQNPAHATESPPHKM